MLQVRMIFKRVWGCILLTVISLLLQMSGITGSGMNQLSMSNAMTMPQMSASYNQLHQPQTNAYSMYNQTGPPPSMGYILPPSSSLNALPHVNSAPGSIYSGPGEMLSGQMQQVSAGIAGQLQILLRVRFI